MRTASFLGGLGLLAALSPALVSCSGGNLPSKVVDAPKFEPPGGGTKCGVLNSQASPLIVEWPDADRGRLESVAKRHVVAVRYVGCDMHVLDQCSAPGTYGYSALTRKKSHVRMRDADDLYANIPVYAAKFEATLQKAGELNVAMTIVGRYEASDAVAVAPDSLRGDCAGATHVVSAMTVGAFEFFAGADATASAGATVGGVGAGAKSEAQRDTLNQDGDKALCEKSTSQDKKAPEGCGALLRVEVVPLGSGRRAEPGCPEGTKWDGAQCVRTQVVTQIQCPAGTRLEGAACVASVSTTCAAGLHFEAGTGCVANAAPAATAAPGAGAAAPTAASPGKGSPATGAALVWQKPPANHKMNWSDAKAYCAKLSLAGHRWRLPSIDELKALNATKPNAEVMGGEYNDFYWSSSPVPQLPSQAWVFNFYYASDNGLGVDSAIAVRCVR